MVLFALNIIHYTYLVVCSYRSPDEIKDVKKKRDPILMMQNRMIDSNISALDELKVSVSSNYMCMETWVHFLYKGIIVA